MAGLPPKAPFHCPACGFVQLEPPDLISTYCRACGTYYEVGRARGLVASERVLFSRPLVSGAKRIIFCHRCGATHSVSAHARSTICPACGTAIDLTDIEFTGPTSRMVDTRGRLTVGPHATLSNSWIVCGSAWIEGTLTGQLISEGDVHFASKQTCIARITASHVIIEKHSRTAITLPVEVDAMTVSGELVCGLLECRGKIHVRRGGKLSANIRARSIVVDKGGSLMGNCVIDQQPWVKPTTAAARSRFVVLRPSPSY